MWFINSLKPVFFNILSKNSPTPTNYIYKKNVAVPMSSCGMAAKMADCVDYCLSRMYSGVRCLSDLGSLVPISGLPLCSAVISFRRRVEQFLVDWCVIRFLLISFFWPKTGAAKMIVRLRLERHFEMQYRPRSFRLPTTPSWSRPGRAVIGRRPWASDPPITTSADPDPRKPSIDDEI